MAIGANIHSSRSGRRAQDGGQSCGTSRPLGPSDITVGSPGDAPVTLTNQDIIDLTAWRRKLHQHPEISSEEEMTAGEVVSFIADTRPDRVLTGLGGHGVAAIYDSGKAGPTVMF